MRAREGEPRAGVNQIIRSQFSQKERMKKEKWEKGVIRLQRQ